MSERCQTCQHEEEFHSAIKPPTEHDSPCSMWFGSRSDPRYCDCTGYTTPLTVAEARIAELESELSALRAAQPLTKEKIDLVIGDIMVATRVRGGTPESRIYFALGSLRDALLDSLADGEKI